MPDDDCPRLYHPHPGAYRAQLLAYERFALLVAAAQAGGSARDARDFGRLAAYHRRNVIALAAGTGVRGG